MTICIAAVCNNHFGGDAKIVLCTDGRASGLLGNRENTPKSALLCKGWWCLTSGTDRDLNAFVPLLRERLRAKHTTDETNLQETLVCALRDLKVVRNNEYTSSKFGLTYEEFLQRGKSIFPEDHHQTESEAIRAIELKLDCIVAGFSDEPPHFPILAKINGEGASIEEGYALAGEGGYLADTALCHRQHHDVATLERTLYCVYEAKRYAERNSTVNDVRDMAICSFNDFFVVRKAAKEYLETLYAKWGPQEMFDKEINLDQPKFLRTLYGNERPLGPKAPGGAKPI